MHRDLIMLFNLRGNVRFHYNGKFIHDGKKMHYSGGTVAMSYIDHDKVSLPELVGHLKDHCAVLDGTLLHWLFLERELHDGLRALVDDKACLDMLRCTEDGFYAEVYVEAPVGQEISYDEATTGSEVEESEYEDEMDGESEDEARIEALPQDADLGSGARHLVPYSSQSGVIVHN
jgi:alpha-galactosidase